MNKTKHPKELSLLAGVEGEPIALLKSVLDALGITYGSAQPEEGDTMIRKYCGVSLDPFLEPNSVLFSEPLGDSKDGLSLITAVEHLSKVRCIAFRTQLTKVSLESRVDRKWGKELPPKIVTTIIAKSDLINSYNSDDVRRNLAETKKISAGSGRLLVSFNPKTHKLRILFESRSGQEIGQCSNEVTISVATSKEIEEKQNVDIHLEYKGNDVWTTELIGRISVWNY